MDSEIDVTWDAGKADEFALSLKSKTTQELANIHRTFWPPSCAQDFLSAGRWLCEVKSRGLTEDDVMQGGV